MPLHGAQEHLGVLVAHVVEQVAHQLSCGLKVLASLAGPHVDEAVHFKGRCEGKGYAGVQW